MKKVYWAIFIIVALAVAAGLLYVINKPTPVVTPVVVKPIVKTQSTTIPSTAASSTTGISGWQTYKNDKFGITFEYPQSASLQETDMSAAQPRGDAPFCPNNPGTLGCLDVNFSLPDGTIFSYIYQTHELGFDLGKIERTENITVGGQNTTLLTDESGSLAVNLGSYTSIMFYNPKQAADEMLFKQILSTFQFIQPQSSTASTAGWQTYSTQAFSIMVPNDWVASTTNNSEGGDPIMVITFSDTTTTYSLLYIMTFPHQYNVNAESDEPLSFLASDGKVDYYYTSPNGNMSITLLNQIEKAVSTFKLTN